MCWMIVLKFSKYAKNNQTLIIRYSQRIKNQKKELSS